MSRTALFLCAHALGREMIKTRHGKIINFTCDLAVKWAQHNIQAERDLPGFFRDAAEYADTRWGYANGALVQVCGYRVI